MVIAFKYLSRHAVPLGKRDKYALNAHDRLNINQYRKNIDEILEVIQHLKIGSSDLSTKILLKGLNITLTSMIIGLLSVVVVEVPNLPIRPLKVILPRMTLDAI